MQWYIGIYINCDVNFAKFGCRWGGVKKVKTLESNGILKGMSLGVNKYKSAYSGII